MRCLTLIIETLSAASGIPPTYIGKGCAPFVVVRDFLPLPLCSGVFPCDIIGTVFRCQIIIAAITATTLFVCYHIMEVYLEY